MFKKVLFLNVLLCLFLVVGCSKKSEVIKIGVACALTGQESSLGQDVANAVRLAVDEANTKGDLPKKIVVDAYDDKSEPKEAVNIAHKFAVDSDIIAVVGHLVSSCTKPASKIYNEVNLPMITPSATNPEITKQGYKNVFRACATDDFQGAAAGDFVIKKLKKRKIAIIHDKQTYGQGLAEEFQKAIKRNNGTVLAFESITPKEMDYSAVLTKLKPKNPEVIYYGGMFNEGSLIAKQMITQNIRAILMGGDGLYVPEFIRLAGKSSEGVIVSFLAPPYDKLDSTKDFILKFNAKYGEIKTYAPFAYDAANIIIDAIRNVCKDAPKNQLNRKNLLQRIAATKGFKGVTGDISFDEKGDRLNTVIYFYKVVNGQFEWIKQ